MFQKSFVRKKIGDRNDGSIVKPINKYIKQDKFKHQQDGENDHNIYKSKSVYTKLNETKSGSLLRSAELKEQRDTRNSVITKIGPDRLKKQKEFGHSVTTKSRNLYKTKSESTHPTDLNKTPEKKNLKSFSICKAEDKQSSFNLLELPFACGDYCLQQKGTDQEKIIILYENYSHVSVSLRMFTTLTY